MEKLFLVILELIISFTLDILKQDENLLDKIVHDYLRIQIEF